MMINQVKHYLKKGRGKAAYIFRVSPNLWQLPNALKIYEFDETLKGVQLKEGQRVLDLGCGRGLQSQIIARQGPAVVGVDPSQKRIQNARRELEFSSVRQRVEFICGTLEDGKFDAASFDYVFSFCVFEHIENLREVFAELHRVLKPGGEIHTTVDALSNIADAALIDLHRQTYSVYRYFRPDTVKAWFAEAGFELFHQRYFLKSPLAREAVIRELQQGAVAQSRAERQQGYQQLVAAERAAEDGDGGIMILCRARKI